MKPKSVKQKFCAFQRFAGSRPPCLCGVTIPIQLDGRYADGDRFRDGRRDPLHDAGGRLGLRAQRPGLADAAGPLPVRLRAER